MGRADLHLHTTYSDGMVNPQTLIVAIEGMNAAYNERYGKKFLDVIAITDHNNIEGAKHAQEFARKNNYDIEVIVGEEVSSKEGHILAINIVRKIKPGRNVADTVEAIHEQGGLAIAAHPYSLSNVFGNRKWRGVGNWISSVNFDAVELINSNPTEYFSRYLTRAANNESRKVAEIGNSDAHFISALGKAWTEFPGTNYKDLVEAIREKTTVAKGTIWGPAEFVQYLIHKRKLAKYCDFRGITPHYL
jgi:predicted metal-dependent phosphoesterase TrpH